MIQPALFAGSTPGDEQLPRSGTLPSGLILLPHFLSKAEERMIADAIERSESPWLLDLRRRVKHLGYRYDYKARALSLGDRIGDLPSWARELGSRFVEYGFFRTQPDQVIVNEYLPGQGIAPHIDRDNCFGPAVASVSLGSDIVMDFRDDNSDATGHVLLPARSAVVFQDDARYRWKHGIAARKSDAIGNLRFDRNIRLSLTFRTVRMLDDASI